MSKLPRPVYWVAGGAIALIGAALARSFAAAVPEHRILIWLGGVAIIFLGLAVLSLGTKARLEQADRIRKKSE
jgi:cytochrome c biogenesis protein CcdA